jgi:hypothetical protein
LLEIVDDSYPFGGEGFCRETENQGRARKNKKEDEALFSQDNWNQAFSPTGVGKNGYSLKSARSPARPSRSAISPPRGERKETAGSGRG